MVPQKDEDFQVYGAENESLPMDVHLAIESSKESGRGYKLVSAITGETYGYVYLGNISRGLAKRLIEDYDVDPPKNILPRPECRPRWQVIQEEMENLGFWSMEFVRKDGVKSRFYVAEEDMPHIPKIFRKIQNKAKAKTDSSAEPPVKYPQFETMQYPTFSEVSDDPVAD